MNYSDDRMAVVLFLHIDKALEEVGYTLASILIKGSCKTGNESSLLFDSNLYSPYKDIEV